MNPRNATYCSRIRATPAGVSAPVLRGLTPTNRLNRSEGSVEPILPQTTPAIGHLA